MDSLVKTRITTLAILLFIVNSPKADPLSPAPDYLPAIQQELTRLGLTPTCNASFAKCSVLTEQDKNIPSLDLTVRYSKDTDTVYIGLNRFIIFENAIPPAIATQLLRLNHEMVTAKFSWNSDTLAIELSASINTDSNFDRRAFRSQVTGLLEIAKKVHPMLVALQGKEVPDKLPNPASDHHEDTD